MHNCVDSCRIYTAHLSPALNRSSEIQRFERSDAIEICNGIISDFYTKLPHMMYLSPNIRTVHSPPFIAHFSILLTSPLPCLSLAIALLPPLPQEASFEYLEREGERTFLECLEQLEVAAASLEVSHLPCQLLRYSLLIHVHVCS